MLVIDSKSDHELLRSLLAETAKATNELNCSLGDVQKAQSRLSFVLALANTLIERSTDQAGE
jgi:hypothetical protein